MENNYKNFNIGDDVTYLRKFTGVKYKGKVIEIDKDGKYLRVRNTIGNIDYLPIKEVKKMEQGGKIGDTIRIAKDMPYMTSLNNLYNKDLKIVDVKDVFFGSGNQKYYTVEVDGEQYEVPGRFTEKKMKKGGSLKGNQKKLDLNKNGKLDAEDFKMLRGNKMAEGGGVDNDMVYFIIDDEALDILLHENFKKYVDYQNLENGDVIYKMDKRQFERFEDLAYSTSQKYEDAIEVVNSDGSYIMAKGGGLGEKWKEKKITIKDIKDAYSLIKYNEYTDGDGISINERKLEEAWYNLFQDTIHYNTYKKILNAYKQNKKPVQVLNMLNNKMAKGGDIDKKKKTDFTISEYIKIQRDKLREHNAKAHEDDRLDWADWKSELTKEDTAQYGIYYNSRMLDQNGDRGVFEYLPTNKNYSEDEYAKGGGVESEIKETKQTNCAYSIGGL